MVSIQVPGVASYLKLLRTVVAGCVAREGFTLDQIGDVKMAVDEAAGQLLKQLDGGVDDGCVRLDVGVDAAGVDLAVSGPVVGDQRVIDPASFSWTILQALSDELAVEQDGHRTTVRMRKLRVDQEHA